MGDVRTGSGTARLGFGCMRLPLLDPEDQTSVDRAQVRRMFDLFLDRGFTYFDTAWMYHDHASERIVRECLVERHPRDSFTLATKMPLVSLSEEADHRRILDEQLAKCGVDHFDYYLLHNVNSTTLATARRLGTFEFVAEARERGLVRRAGFSFHDSPQLLDEVLTEHPEMEFVQLQVNYFDWDDPGIQARRCYEVARAHGKDVAVMEPVKGGTLADVGERALALMRGADPDATPAEWAIRYAASLPGVFVVLSGMSDLAQVDENTRFMSDLAPLTDEERAMLGRVARVLGEDRAIPCTSCRYCVAGCPRQIPIPTYFALYNQHRRRPSSGSPQAYYDNYATRAARASECVGCRRCVAACPQHILIPEMLAEVSAAFDGGAGEGRG